jgi:superfamily II DNA/RNA helicase
MPRTLILEPTRELAAQVAENFDIYGKYNTLTKALIIGGESMDDQARVLDRGVDVLIATPGRLLDIFDRGRVLLSDVKILVIDEADRMLDMGFIPDVERIVTLLPKIRQTLFFSATMPPEIKRLADAFLMNPKEITVARPATAASTISQFLVNVPHRNKRDHDGLAKKKRDVLRRLIAEEQPKNAIIFCNRKRDVDIVNKSFRRHGFNSGQLHGDMVQSARTETMEKFKAGDYQYLICSDVAARGLDIDDLSHVFNFDVPMHADDYIHRIGRTGRAGRMGRAFTLAAPEDQKFIDAIEKLTGKSIPRAETAATAGVTEDSPEMTSRERGRGRERDRNRSRRGHERDQVQAAEDHGERAPEPVAAQERNEARPERRAEQRQNDRRENRRDERRSGRQREPEPAVVGMGDHVPAFLLQTFKL